MHAWHSRWAMALLSISLTQAGLLAACASTENVNAAHQMPCCPRHSCCSPNVVVQAVIPQLPTRGERPWVADSHSADVTTSPLSVPFPVGIGMRVPNAVPWLSEDLFVRFHVFLI
jgi:hypothetical protein